MRAIFQPPMPKCPEGAYCAQVMPAPIPVVAEWISSNPGVASIDIIGSCAAIGCPVPTTVLIKGISNGVVYIKAAYKSPYGKDTVVTATARVTVGAVSSPSITVLSPNGGEQLQLGSTQPITWSVGSFGRTYRISVVDKNGFGQGDVATVTGTATDKQVYYWNVGQVKVASDRGDLQQTLSVGEYKILIIEAETGSSDYSNSPFSIVAGVQSSVKPMVFKDILKIESVIPYDVANLGFGVYQVSAQYNLGAYHQGKWYEGLNPGISGPVWVEFGWPNRPDTDVVLQDENGISRKIYLPSVGANTTSYGWYYWIAEDGSSYYAHTSHGPGWPNLSSNESLRPEHLARKAGASVTPFITVLSPNGGEKWIMGESQTVKWTGSNGTRVNITLLNIDKTKEVYGLAGSIVNDGNELIKVPYDLPAGQYYLRVSCVEKCSPEGSFDDSNAPFSIVALASTSVDLKVNGSDTPSAIPYGSVFTASWISTGATYCTGYGVDIVTVDGGVWTSGNYPASGSKTLYAKSSSGSVPFSSFHLGIQCWDSSGKSVTDLIENIPVSFVSTPSITVTYPNGEEALIKGHSYFIKWAQTGFASDGWIQLQLRDANNPSSMVKLIAASVPIGTYAGSFNWTVPIDIPDEKYLIWASAGSGSDALGTRVLGSDFSNAPFTISGTPGTADASSGGDSSLAALIFSLERQIEELRQILNSLLAP